MIIRQLALSNFMGYRKRCELDLQGKETIGIVGQNESGKSTLLSAISYLCFGDIPILNQATREVNLISDGATADAVVEGEVELASGEVLTITRGRTKANSPIVRLDGMPGKPSEVAAAIEEKLGVPFEDFIALSYFVQGDIHQFMEGNKREYFQRWAARLRRWERYEDQAKAVVAAAQAQHQRLQQDIERNVVSAEEEDDANRELAAAAKALSEKRASEALIRAQTDSLQDERARQQEAAAEAVGAGRGAEKELERVRTWTASLEGQVRRLQAQVHDARAGLCPILRQPCAKLTERNEDRQAEARKDLGQAKQQLSDAREQEEQLQEKVRAAKAAAREDKPRGPDISKLLAEAKQELGAAVSATTQAAQRLGRAEERIRRLQYQRRLVKDAQDKVAEAEADMRRALFLQSMCGRSGIPLEVMDSELQAVEDKCNWVLQRLDYPKRIRFAASRELAGFEKVCPSCGSEKWRGERCADCGAPRPHKRKDEPEVTILEGDVERPFSLESGGARVLQSFATRLAGSRFVAAMTGVQIRMVMLDEVFAMLDASNRQKLMALIIGKLSSEFGFRQQLVVSHQEDVVNAVDDILVVEKRGGSSVARWA